MKSKKSKKSKKNKKSKNNKKEFPNERSFARYRDDEDRRHRLDEIQTMMDYLVEIYGDPEQQKQALRECAATIEAYTVYAEAITGDQYIFNLQSTYSSDENLQSAYSSDETVAVDTFVDESMVASESADPKTFANLFEEFVDKLNDMAGLLPVSKNGKAKVKEGDDVNAKVKERTTLLIKSGSDAKGSGTGEKVGAFRNIDEEESDEDLVGIAEQLLNMRYLSLHQNNKYLQL
nr:uncharacterized protein LOC109166660 [Ipomoea batatas]